jgi:hypothetical protein
MMAKEILSFPVWKERVDGPDAERFILAGDWRDPDRVIALNGLTLYSNDNTYQESHSKGEPDWSMGVQARDDQNRVILEFPGEPPAFIKECLLAGVLLEGILIGRDFQRHGR